MTSSQSSPKDTAQDAAPDGDAAPAAGSEPDSAAAASAPAGAPDAAGTDAAASDAGESDVAAPGNGSATSSPERATRTVLDGPALENEEMRGATEDLQSSETASAEAREIARDLSDATEPDRQD